jgi:hypothetical protein
VIGPRAEQVLGEPLEVVLESLLAERHAGQLQEVMPE